jgi:two-component system, LytTR family, response regulator
MPLSTLVVDDEPLAREGLRMLLAEDAEVGAIHEARNGHEAVAAIRDRRPDLVFLDVQMPEMNGFAVLQEVGPDHMPAVVMVTAHDQYALQAFEINAIDYLLKPVTSLRFAQALERAKVRLTSMSQPDAGRQILSLLETVGSPKRYVKRLAIQSAGKTFFLPVEDLDWIQSAENYVELHTERASHLLHVTMTALEQALDPEFFLRIHRSLMVNTRRIKEIRPGAHTGYMIVLDTGVRLQSGRTYQDRIKALISNPF